MVASTLLAKCPCDASLTYPRPPTTGTLPPTHPPFPPKASLVEGFLQNGPKPTQSGHPLRLQPTGMG